MPVAVFIAQQSPEAAQRLMKAIEHFAERGMALLANPSRMKALRGYKNLYELRVDCQGAFYRIFFCVIHGVAHLLAAFKKKDNRTAERHIRTAVNRQQTLLATSK